MNKDTVFRIYSMTKPIVSVALMILYEQNEIGFEDQVSKYLPEFKNVKVLEKSGGLIEPRNEIRIIDLLTHTAGLSYGNSGNQSIDNLFDQAQIYDENIELKEMVYRIASLPLLFHPGEGWHYSVATDVIGHLIEVISGMTLEKFLQDNIFNPLGMTETGYYFPHPKRNRLAVLYTLNSDGQLVEVEDIIGGSYSPKIRLHPGGHGLISTILDYYKFCKMLLDKGKYGKHQILSSNSINLMTQNFIDDPLFPLSYNGLINEPVKGIGFGLGFRVITDINQTGLKGNDGSYGWGGMANTMFWIDPKQNLIAILMAQIITEDVHPIRNIFHTSVYEAI